MQALTRGYNDFAAMPSHAVFLCVIYPLLGLLLIAMTLGYSMSLAFPLAAGFALIGPLAVASLSQGGGAGPQSHPACQPRDKIYRSAADFPAALFPAHR
jgi:uncharacterized membrane protein